MRKLFVSLAFVLAMGGVADAGNKVLFFGDSRTNTGSSTNQQYPKLVGAARTDLTICINYANGRNTVEALAAQAAAIASCSGATDAVILLGVVDLLEVSGTTPYDTATRILQIADAFEAADIRAWIMLEPPAPGPSLWNGLDGDTYAESTAASLRALGEGGDYRFIGNGGHDEYDTTLWASCSTDRLHPTGLLCRQGLAAGPIVLLPH